MSKQIQLFVMACTLLSGTVHANIYDIIVKGQYGPQKFTITLPFNRYLFIQGRPYALVGNITNDAYGKILISTLEALPPLPISSGPEDARNRMLAAIEAVAKLFPTMPINLKIWRDNQYLPQHPSFLKDAEHEEDWETICEQPSR